MCGKRSCKSYDYTGRYRELIPRIAHAPQQKAKCAEKDRANRTTIPDGLLIFLNGARITSPSACVRRDARPTKPMGETARPRSPFVCPVYVKALHS
ncbi:hypothetical protein QE152_g23140 [Popillia japonica]|uniref:Uncharacterized protein n=1 Tax=Popillia japonica TaxID=7064 RepID=A0AAW1KJN0_POPJA